ncbi:unnamed protein product [Paramecium sonneborni]|uniref:Transmembrane protein n=1 Tax=Paramecium sonneborni TaxID=65129 RepID=A0A8S1QNN3_9CILI|nr:unnamed protein product [Paramecium sonneborni]
MQKNSLSLLIALLLALFEQVYSSCNYISTDSTILSLLNPQLEIDVELEHEIFNSQKNIGYGLWFKYQPFLPISDISYYNIGKVSSEQFIYLLQQKETKFNLLTFYISISDETQTITHNVFYSFKTKIDTLVFNFEHEKYEGQWMLFYFYFNLQSEQTTIGFYSLEQTMKTKTQILNDIPALVKNIRHQIGGKYEITNQIGENLSLTQFIGRLSTIFSQGSVNIFQDFETFLLVCTIESECQESTYTISSIFQAFLGQSYQFGSTSVFEYPIYVIKGWLKLQPLEKSPLDTVIFRVTINQNYQNDTQIGDKALYLQYHQNTIPESNGFSISTYSYDFPTFNRYKSTAADVISDFGAQYLELLVKWHYIQYEIGTNNNQGQPIFQIYFPSQIENQKIFQWKNYIKHFTGTKMYFYVGGDKQSKNFLKGHISDMQLISYCKTPIITLFPNCHYSCLTCDGPNNNNCLSCPQNSQRIQSVNQKICSCKKRYLDIENQSICKPVSEIFPQMTEVELELNCPQGYDVCTEEQIVCSFGYFFYQNYGIDFRGQCLKCPGYSSLNTRSLILCSNCIFDQSSFHYLILMKTFCITQSKERTQIQNNIKQLKIQMEIMNQFQSRDFMILLIVKKDTLKNENCISCAKGCQTCQYELVCETCFPGYILSGDYLCIQCPGCSDCTIFLEKVQCKMCATRTYLSSNGACISCGQNCSSCDSNGICQYCDDPSKYFKTFDGHNCQICSITDCIYCFQYYLKNGITYTTLDINYEILEQNQESFYIGCALCQANLYYNQITLSCEEKPLISSTYDNCTFGLIINSFGKSECLISSTSKISTQNTDCQSISNCQQCIKRYSQFFTFCIICEDGFYSSTLNGQCLKCDSNCKTCVQQSQTYQDYWKWNIKAYYKYVFNYDDSHSFETYAVEIFKNDFEVVCTSCPLGFILNKFKCIKNCDLECLKCVIINEVATCVQCLETPYGFQKSLDSNGKCLACPSNCGACLDRTNYGIELFNPNFITSTTNLKYTRICYEQFHLDSFEGYYFNDQSLKTITFCEKYNKCYHKVIFVNNIYCSQNHFNRVAASFTGETLDAFKKSNIYISDLFEKGYLSAVETFELFQYLNEKVIREDQGEVCIIPQESNLFSKVQQNVFTVQSVSLLFIGQKFPTTVIVENVVYLRNFTTITFKNLQFAKDNFIELGFTLENTKNFEILDCIFTQIAGINKFYRFFFYPYIDSLSIINLIIENLKTQDWVQIFQFNFQLKSKISVVKLINLKIINSYFYSFRLFYFEGGGFNIIMKYINITNTTFEHFSSFIYLSTDGSFYDSYLLTQEVKLNAVTINEESVLFYFQGEGENQSQLKGLIVLDCIISQQSYLYNSNNFELQNIYISNTNIINSTIFSNNAFSSRRFYFEIIRNASIINCTIENVYYNEQQAIIHLISVQAISALNIQIKLFKLLKSRSTINIEYNDIYNKKSIIYIQCQVCILEDVEIEREYGLPEITILNSKKLTLNRIKFTQSILFRSKTLHKSVDCMLNYALYNNMYFYLYIGFYHNITINNLEIIDSITYNNPFIIIKAHDITDKIQKEYINIQNSRFESNMLVITKRNTISSIISLFSEQNCQINISRVVFNNNHLNQYIQDLTRQSASTLLIQLQQGNVQISNTIFKQNIVTNSTDSILYIKSINVLFQNNQFFKNNILEIQNFIKNVLLFEDGQYNGRSLMQAFPINSKGGNGQIFANKISIFNTSINNSFSLFGGGFYLVALDTGTILIENSIFQNTLTSLASSSFSTGGCLYIDAQLSKLHLQIYSTTIENSFSRVQGGGIYIVPSEQENFVTLQNLTVINCFSIQYGFFSYLQSSLQSINSKVQFSRAQFMVTQAGFMKFLSLLESPTKMDVGFIRTNNPLIKIKFGSILMKNCSFISTHIQFLIDIEFAHNILIKDMYIINSTILFSPLIRLSLRQQSSGYILIININAENVQQHTNYSDLGCQISTKPSLSSLECKGGIPQKNLIVDDYNQYNSQEQQQLCNQKEVYQQANYSFSLFEIDNLNQTHRLEVQGLNFDSIRCVSCTYGILRIKDIFQSQIENIFFNNIKILNSQCGQTGCLSFIQSEDDPFFRRDLLTNRRRILQKHDYINLIQQLGYQARIINSKFFNNYATFGGAVFIVQTKIIIHNCLFESNKAEMGGAFYYFSNESSMIIIESQIIENQAKIAGGLYLNKQQLQETVLLNVFLFNNNSTLFGSDVSENPRSLTISIDGGQTFLTKIKVKQSPTMIIDKIVVNPYKVLGQSERVKYLTLPSGRQIFSYKFFDLLQSEYIPYNLSFRIIALNKQNTQEKKLAGTTCTQTPTIINTTSGEAVQGLMGTLSYNKVKFNENTGDYNLDDLIIYFNPSYDDDIILRLNIQCSIILIPQYEVTPPYLIKNYISNYNLLVDIKTFQCQLGEFLNATSGGCTLCDIIQGQFSVQRGAQSCSYKDDQKIKSIKSSMIELRNSYWRAYYYSLTIEYCYHMTLNCVGGWQSGDKSCAAGHIGALCEQCDLYNIRGDGSYSVSSLYSCGSCEEISGNVLAIVSISIWTLVSIFMSVSSTVDMIEEYMIGFRLSALGVAVAINQISTAMLIKIFTNYLQIISTISTFQLQVPSQLTSIVNSVGNPIEQMAYSLDCFLINVSDIPIIYFRIIWSLIMAFSYITLFITFGGIAIMLNLAKYKFSYIPTAFIYVFIYLQPTLIGSLISQISYRVISDEYWIQGNVAYRYDTEHHVKWLLAFCIPLLLFFGAIIPAYLWYGVRKNLHCLNSTKVRQIWGYLYSEYKLYAYYWETIKIVQKELIIIVLAYYEDYIPIKASLVFLALFGYSFLATAKKPYNSNDLNYLDSKSTVACAVSFILASSIYTAQSSNIQEIVWPFYIIIGILNALFIVQMLIKILSAYFVKLSDQIDKVKNFINHHFPNLIIRYPFIAKILESRKKKLERIKCRFGKLRTYLRTQAKKRIGLRKEQIIIYCKMNNSEYLRKNNPNMSSKIG